MGKPGNDTIVIWLAFIGAALAVVAQSEAAPAPMKLGAAAIAAGCGAALALLRSPGQPKPPEGGAGRG